MSAPSGRDKGTVAHAVLHRCLVSIYHWGLPARASDYLEAKFPVEDEPHGALSPSGAKQWMYCPASVAMQKEHPEPEEGEPGRLVALDAEHAAAVQMCLDYVAQRVAELGQEYDSVEVLTERKVHPGRFFNSGQLRESLSGTLDICLIANAGNEVPFVEIVDFKGGAAVQIEPEDPQLDEYLLGLLARFYMDLGPAASARLTVVQPRNFRQREKIRWREIPSVKIWSEAHLGRVKEALRRIEETPDTFSPSPETCYGCSAKGVCAASYRFALDKASILPEGAALPKSSNDMYALLQEGSVRDTRTLSGAQLRGVLDAREMLKGALQAAEAWALDRMTKGSAPPEVTEWYMLVRGRSSRKWAKEEEETLKRLRRLKVQGPDDEKPRALGKKELTENRLKSAPQVEALLKSYSIPADDARWAAFRALVEKPEGALTIAPRSDPRPEVKPLRNSPEQAFAVDPEKGGGAIPAKTEG